MEKVEQRKIIFEKKKSKISYCGVILGHFVNCYILVLNLQELRVTNCVLDIESLVSNLPTLETLVVMDCSHVITAAPPPVIDSYDSCCHAKSADSCSSQMRSQLRRLVMHDYDGLPDEALVRTLDLCPLLNELNLTEMDSLTYSAVSRALISCRQLESLKMADCLGLRELSPPGSSLECSALLTSLDVSGCRRSTWDAILFFCGACPRLRRLKACRLPDLLPDQVVALLLR